MHYLVTGGTGFVGAYVVRDLARQGHEVVIFDLALNRKYLQDILSAEELQRVQLVTGDVTDLPALLHTMQDAVPRRVVHFAATQGSSSEANPLRTLRVNCEGTIHLFEAALACNVEKVVWGSSTAVFGLPRCRPPGEIANDAYHQPHDLYGACQAMNEQLGRHYRRCHGLDCTGVRFSMVYGYGQALTIAPGTGVDFLAELIDKPALGQPGMVPYGQEILDWLYVEDAARAVLLASNALRNRSIGLNICGERSTVQGVATRLKHLLPNASLTVQPGIWDGAMHFETATTEAEINYSPRVSLEEGLRRSINMLRAQHGLPTI